MSSLRSLLLNQAEAGTTAVMNVTLKQLAKKCGEPYHTLQYWCTKGLLEFSRHSRKRIFPLEENLKRVRFIRWKQGNKEFTPLVEVHRAIERGEHRKKGG
jgi:DNA-binding transcriptional MerR regulator